MNSTTKKPLRETGCKQPLIKTIRSIKVGPCVYRLWSWGKENADIADKFGYCDNVTSEIFVEEDLESSRRKLIVLHEVLHAIWASAAVQGPEEQIVTFLAPALLSFIQDNSKFIDWLKR